MGGTNSILPGTTSSATAHTSAASTQAKAGTSAPPALFKDFTDDSFAKSDNAKNTQKDIQQFYNGQYTHDWQALQSAEAGGDKGKVQQAETTLAADIAALHNLEKQFYVANGDPAHQAGKYDQANFTQEGTTEDLLKQAGAPDAASGDYTFQGIDAGTASGAGTQVTAQLTKDKSFQATVDPQLSATNGQLQVTSSSGQTGTTWTQAANTGNLDTGQSNTATTYYGHDADGKVIPK